MAMINPIVTQDGITVLVDDRNSRRRECLLNSLGDAPLDVVPLAETDHRPLVCICRDGYSCRHVKGQVFGSRFQDAGSLAL